MQIIRMTEKEELGVIIKALDSKKAGNIKILEIGDITVLANYFVIAQGTSSTQVKTLADEVEFKMGEAGVQPKCSIKQQGTEWITIDYIDIVVHVFLKETREFYGLERLWQDGKEIDIREFL